MTRRCGSQVVLLASRAELRVSDPNDLANVLISIGDSLDHQSQGWIHTSIVFLYHPGSSVNWTVPTTDTVLGTYILHTFTHALIPEG